MDGLRQDRTRSHADEPERARRGWLVGGVVALVAMTLGVVVGFALVGFDVVGLARDASTTAAAGAAGDTGQCADDDQARLTVVTAPEIADAVRAVARDSADAQAPCTSVQVRGIAPSAVRDAFTDEWDEQNDGAAPHVWIPTSTTDVALAGGDSAVTELLPDDPPSIARSPTVIAMPRPMADALDWPSGALTWKSLADLAATEDAWQQRGHGDWGSFNLSLVDGVAAEPSVTAIGALSRAIGALPGSDATEAQREQAQAQLLLLERRVDYRGSTTDEQLDRLRRADEDGRLLQTVSAIPLTEQMVWRYNGGPDDAAAPPTPLAAWYPEDGGPDADYPYLELDAPWASGDTSDAAATLLEALQSDAGADRLAAAGFRDSSRAATETLTQADGTRPELAPDEPEPIPALFIGPVVQAWRGLAQTGNLLAVIDVSGSMATEVPGTGASRLALSSRGMAAGITLLDPESSAGIWEFSTQLQGGQDHRELVSLGPLGAQVGSVTRQQAAVAAIEALQPRADTGLFDTIAASYAHMVDNYEPGRLNAVIFFTDGRNDDSDGISLAQLRRRLRQTADAQRPVQFLGVAYGAEADFETLETVTDITGGKLYRLERPEDIREVFVDVQTGDVD